MITSFILLALGILLLVKGADLLIDGSVSLANKFNISSLVVGLTIVAFGTSLPETVVNVCASLNQHTDITFGNIIGSNICNILLILGVCTCIRNLLFQKSTIRIEIPFAFLAAAVFFLLSNKQFFGLSGIYLTAIDGGIMLFFFMLFLYYIYLMCKNKNTEQDDCVKTYSWLKTILYIISGLIFLCFGGKLSVNSAVDIAKTLGISDLLISCTVLAIGTSLPEAVTSIVSVIKKQMNIAVGNIVGSNIFNILFIMSVSTFISPLKIPSSINYDFSFMFLATVLLWLFSVGKKNLMYRWQGIVFLLIYCGYIGFLVIRG